MTGPAIQLIAAGRLALVVGLVSSWLASASQVAPNPVSAWNALALEAIRFANTPPPMASRQLAIMHTAMFDAVNGLAPKYENYRQHTNSPTPASASPEAAAAAAANRTLRYLYPQFTTTMDAALQAHLASLPDGPEKTAGVAWGRQVAQNLLLQRDFDGSNYGADYRASPQPGHWQPTPPQFASPWLPQWPRLKPFVLERADQFRAEPPPVLDGPEWAEQMNQVKSLGGRNSTNRTPEQTEIAFFWADGVGSETPPGHWNGVAQQFAKTKDLPLLESARLFALLNLALADAAISSWDSKYAYDWWRPITAIRGANSDGNPATEPNENWTPLILTPPFPEHTSGHSTFSAAAAAVLQSLNGSDDFKFTLYSNGLFGAARTYDRFSEAAAEAGMSRIFGGIHFMAANREGQRTGKKVGEYVIQHALRPLDK
ncbi:MAG TPA: vanadium-dependent haloperoxidase [Verrucomicrobiota bacterium]|nr:hypothetical protein [Verrucomicrobiales bacterium]HRI14168.1 vanadium-dependent haloperoxidase [Verrucomicrobiota bacterium]